MIPKMRRTTAVVIFTALIIILVNLAWWLFYARTEKSFEQQLSHRLSSLAALGSSNLKPELINSLIDGYLSAYDSTLEIAEQIKEADSLAEVFILDRDYNYLVTTLIEADSAYYLTALNGEYIDSAFMSFIAEPIVTDGYRVEDVVLKSAFVPLFDTSGLVTAVMGIEADVDYTDVLIDLRNNLYISSSISIVAGLIFGLFFFIVQRKIIAAEKSLFLSQSQANLGRMVAVVSHEIKNPLMIIRASAERLRKQKKESPEADFIIEETDRLNGILTGYLDFASGKIKLVKEAINLNELIEKLGEKFMARLSGDGVSLTIRLTEKDLFAEADHGALRQVVVNLILNGADAARENMEKEEPKVEIVARKTNGRAVIEVLDNGRGIGPKDKKSIFEPFYTTKISGSGLGLFHSRRLIEEMGCQISVDSDSDGRTVFRIFLKYVEKV